MAELVITPEQLREGYAVAGPVQRLAPNVTAQQTQIRPYHVIRRLDDGNYLVHDPAGITTSTVGCARCQGDGHTDLAFQPLIHPVELDGIVVATHWAPCPLTGELILLRQVGSETSHA